MQQQRAALDAMADVASARDDAEFDEAVAGVETALAALRVTSAQLPAMVGDAARRWADDGNELLKLFKDAHTAGA
jgi:hypothetical protein